MAVFPKNDIEAINTILCELHKNVNQWHTYEMLKEWFEKDYEELDRIVRKMGSLNLLSHHKNNQSLFMISDLGREIQAENGSYSKFIDQGLKHKDKRARTILLDRYIKNGNTIAAILISALTLILTQCPIQSNKQQQRIEEGIQSVAKQLDSLRKDGHNIQEKLEKAVKIDTVLNK